MANKLKYKFLLITLVSISPVFSYATEMSHSYQDCIKKAYGQNDYLHCITSEIKRQDKRLNDNYQSALNSIEEFRKKDLRSVQRVWIKYRDAKCSFFHHMHGGSGSLVDEQQCVLEETIRRANELEQLF